MKRRALPAGLIALAALAGCQRSAPFPLGFLAGLSGRGAVTSEDGRNGAMLAVEQVNATGGVRGRVLELVVQDNGDDAATARLAMQRLLDGGVHAIVGPFASAIATAVLPQAEQAGVLLLSPNATAASLAGLDDMLVMLSPSTRQAARAYARLLWQRGLRRLAIATATDPRNAVYAVSWRDEFVAAYRALGGVLVAQADFASDAGTAYSAVVGEMLAGQPDGLVFACGSVDAVRLAQQARRRASVLPVAVADAAAGEALLTLGGAAVEGIIAGQMHDRSSTAPRYLAFVEAFRSRFGRLPGYHAVVSHDAVSVLVQALARRAAGETLKQAVLRHGPYAGLQHDIALDAAGDTAGTPHFVVVRGGHFEALR